MQSETGIPSSHQLKSYVASKSRLKLAARAVLSADAGLRYIMKRCSRLFVFYCRSRPEHDKSRHFDPHFEEVRGGVEPWCMARWKARAEFFFLSVIELLSSFSISYGCDATRQNVSKLAAFRSG